MSKREIRIEITDASEFHCFRMTIPAATQEIEIMLHARSLVDLIHNASVALCEWQRETSEWLVLERLGISRDEAIRRGLIAETRS